MKKITAKLLSLSIALCGLLLSNTSFAQTVYSIPNSGCSTCNNGAYGPVDICDGEYTAEADIFPSSSLSYGTVTKIAYDQISGSQTNVPVKIYLASTSATAFSSAGTWSSVISGATLVFSGNVSFTSSGWKTITLTTPFNYTSGNLEVMIETDWGTATTCSNNPIFYYYTASSNIDQFWESYTTSSSALQSETGVIGDQPAPIQVTITSCSLPSITSQPSTSSQADCQGGTTTALSITASGTSLTYQWYKNTTNSNSGGTAISGATSSSYTPSTSATGTLYYYCIVYSNGACAVTSNVSGGITINPIATISSQSTGTQTLCQGGTATAMSVTATGSTLTYQWYSNTANSNSGGTAISGATSSSYTPSTANTGTLYYYCNVYSSGICPVTSAVSGAIIVNGTSAPTGTTPQIFCSSANPTVANLTATGTSIQWYAAASGGSTLASSTALTNGTTYYATQTVSGCQSVSRLAVTATVNTAPSIASQSTGPQYVCKDSFAVALSVTATGTSLTYQWYMDTAAVNSGGTLISGATSSSYTPSTHTPGTWYYYCVVSGAAPCTSVTSAVSGNIVSYLCNINGLAAGGDLSGTYPNPTVAKINHMTVPPSATGALTNNGSGILSWVQYLTSISGIGAGGDLSGTFPSPTVAKINGNTVPSNANGYLHNDGSGNLSWGAGGTTGSGTVNNVPVWATSTSLSNSPITISGTNVGIGGTAQYPLEVFGNAAITGDIYGQNIYAANKLSAGNFRFVNGVADTIADSIVSNAPVLHISATNVTMANNLSVTANSVSMPGIVADTLNDTIPQFVMQMDKHGKLSPINNTVFHNLLYNTMYNCDPTCNGELASWHGTSSVGTNAPSSPAVLSTDGCEWVGIGTKYPDAPLTVVQNINNLVGNFAFTVQNTANPCPGPNPIGGGQYTLNGPNSPQKDVFTIDGAGSTFMNGQLTVNVSPTIGPVGGLTASFMNNNSKIFTASNMVVGDWNPLTLQGDNGIFWSDGYAGNSTSGFVIAPWSNLNAGMRFDAYGDVAIGFPEYEGKLNVCSTTSNSELEFSINNQAKKSVFNIDNGGNTLINGIVSIGNPTIPAANLFITGDYRLFVAGGILTEHCKVAIANSSNWSDFVFSNTYKLPTIDSVSAFIKENHHLIGIPSATEVTKDGVDLGDMDSKLLQKIEEMTLYMIKQQEQLKNEQEQIKKLEAKVEELSTSKK